MEINNLNSPMNIQNQIIFQGPVLQNFYSGSGTTETASNSFDNFNSSPFLIHNNRSLPIVYQHVNGTNFLPLLPPSNGGTTAYTTNQYQQIGPTIYVNGNSPKTESDSGNRTYNINPKLELNKKRVKPTESLMKQSERSLKVDYSKHKLILSADKQISIESLLGNPSRKLESVASTKELLPRESEIERTNSEVKISVPNDKQVYYLDSGYLKPILSPNIKSGIFRSTASILKETAEQIKIEMEEGGCESDSFKNESEQLNPNIIVHVRGKVGKIIPIEEYNDDIIEYVGETDNSVDDESNDNFLENDSDVNDEDIEKQPPKINILSDEEVGRNWTSDKEKVEIDDQQLKHITATIFTIPGNGNILLQDDKKSVLYQNLKTQQNTLYRIVTPDECHLEKCPPSVVDTPSKINRNKPYTETRGRPKKVQQNKAVKLNKINDLRQIHKLAINNDIKPIARRTRCGRIVRPPKHMDTFTHELIDGYPVIRTTFNRIPGILNERAKFVVNERLDDYTTSQLHKGLGDHDKRERKIPDHYKCNTCKKIYLGHNKIQKHLKSYPDHSIKIPGASQTKRSTVHKPADGTFDYLMKKIEHLPKDEKVNALFTEVSEFVEKLKFVGTKILGENIHAPIEYLDENVSQMLGIRSGNYQINIDNLNQLLTKLNDSQTTNLYSNRPDIEQEINQLPNIFTTGLTRQSTELIDSTNRMEYNLNLSLDSIGDSKLHLTDGMTDETFLQTVDDLVKERINNLPSDALSDNRSVQQMVSYDHINDNAVESAATLKDTPVVVVQPQMLDLSLDIFQFNSN